MPLQDHGTGGRVGVDAQKVTCRRQPAACSDLRARQHECARSRRGEACRTSGINPLLKVIREAVNQRQHLLGNVSRFGRDAVRAEDVLQLHVHHGGMASERVVLPDALLFREGSLLLRCAGR